MQSLKNMHQRMDWRHYTASAATLAGADYYFRREDNSAYQVGRVVSNSKQPSFRPATQGIQSAIDSGSREPPTGNNDNNNFRPLGGSGPGETDSLHETRTSTTRRS